MGLAAVHSMMVILEGPRNNLRNNEAVGALYGLRRAAVGSVVIDGLLWEDRVCCGPGHAS